jgi:hypothetical protein
MSSRRRARPSVSVCVLGFVVLVALVVAPLQAQEKDARKLDRTQLAEAQALAKLVDTAQAGQAMPSDVPITIDRYDFFRAASGHTYVPFILSIDNRVLANPAVSLMLRVVKKGAKPVPPKERKAPQVTAVSDRPVNDLSDLRDLTEEERAKAQAEREKLNLAPAAFEDLYFLDLKPAQAGEPARLSRAFLAEAGEYDVYLGLKERKPADKKQKPRLGVYKQTITVPDYNGSEIVTSSLVLADKIEPLAKPLSADQQWENPYTIGQLQIVPKVDTRFAKTQELSVYFQIYNAALNSAGKPDVLVEWGFYQKNADGEKKIFTTDPTILNASTLPPQFDVAKHQLAGGSAWPLSSFQTGDFRLEIKITDKVSGKTLTKNVSFSVS